MESHKPIPSAVSKAVCILSIDRKKEDYRP